MSSNSANHPLKFLDIDPTQISITEFKKNDSNDGKRAFVNYSKTHRGTKIQMPTFTAIAGVKRFEPKLEKDGKMSKPSISLIFPLSQDPLLMATHVKVEAIYNQWLDMVKKNPETFNVDPEEKQIIENFNMKLKSPLSWQKDKKTGKVMKDRPPCLKVQFKFDEKTNRWFNENQFNKLKQHEYVPAVCFQQLVWNEALGKKMLRDRSDITPLNIDSMIPRMSKLTILVQMNSIHEVNGNFSVPIVAKKVVFELPPPGAEDVDLGDMGDVGYEQVQETSKSGGAALDVGVLSALALNSADKAEYQPHVGDVDDYGGGDNHSDGVDFE